MNTIKLNKEENEEQKFDEVMQSDGNWDESVHNYNDEIINKIDMCFYSNRYNYFIAEDSKGKHTLLRNHY